MPLVAASDSYKLPYVTSEGGNKVAGKIYIYQLDGKKCLFRNNTLIQIISRKIIPRNDYLSKVVCNKNKE